MDKNEKQYDAMLTAYGLGAMMKSKRMRIAEWLRTLADDIEENGREYTKGRFIGRFMKK
jgi:hypothetical protein